MDLHVSPVIPQGAAGTNCYLCHGAQRTLANGQRERMIDTLVHIEMEGFIAICESCVGHMADALGMFRAGDVEEILSDLEAALETNTGLEQTVDRLKKTVEAQQYLLRKPAPETPEPVPA